jgi:hypothetical protein
MYMYGRREIVLLYSASHPIPMDHSQPFPQLNRVRCSPAACVCGKSVLWAAAPRSARGTYLASSSLASLSTATFVSQDNACMLWVATCAQLR